MSGPRLAVLCSAHGLGHLTRQLAIGAELERAGARLCFFTAAPPAVVHETLPGAEVRPWTIDVGVVQRDSVREDVEATAAALALRCAEPHIDALAAALRGLDGVVVDTAPVGLEAAARAELPSVAVGSFTWPWIYRRYPALEGFAARLEAMQRPHPAVEILPGPGLAGFASIRRRGWVGRAGVRRALGLAGRVVLVSFGGFGLTDVDRLLPRLPGVTWALAPPMRPLDRPDCAFLADLPYPDLVASADAVLTKPGYSILVEAALAGTPLCWVSRGAFPEAPWLEAAMAARGDQPLGRAGPGEGPEASPARVAEALEALWRAPRPPPLPAQAAADVARDALELLGIGS